MTSRKKKLPTSAASKKDQPANYEVGFKKPPVNTRFKPGQSGNPAGRAKSNASRTTRKALLQIILDEAERIISGTLGELPTVTAIVRSMNFHAIKGDRHCLKLALSLMAEAYKANPPPDDTIDWSKLSDEEVDMAVQIFAKAQGIEED